MRITGFDAYFLPNDGLTRVNLEGVVDKNEYDRITNAYNMGEIETICLSSGRITRPSRSGIRGGRGNYYYYSNCTFSDYGIKRVIFHDPATIVFWTDGTKTIVKTGPDDTYNPEVGLAMCISKKALGDGFHHEFKKWIK